MILSKQQSEKRKEFGEDLQRDTVGLIGRMFPEIAEDITSCPMSARGEDVVYPYDMTARLILPCSFELKRMSKGLTTVYNGYDQAKKQERNIPATFRITPVAVFQQNDLKPLAVTSLYDYLRTQRLIHDQATEIQYLKQQLKDKESNENGCVWRPTVF